MTAIIPLTRGYVAVINDADRDDVVRFKWHVKLWSGGGPYAERGFRRSDGSTGTEYLHRRLLPGADRVDHINGDGLDNRRSNLRPATKAENARNRSGLQSDNNSGYRGVSWDGERHKWVAFIRVPVPHGQGFRKFLGRYAKPEDAARAFDQAARELYGEFAGRLNFPFDAPEPVEVTG